MIEPDTVPFVELLPWKGTTRQIRCRWDDRFRLANELLGRHCGRGNLVLSSIPPEHPRHPGFFAQRLEITGDGPPSNRDGVFSFDSALIAVYYAKPEFIPGMASVS